MQGRRDSVSVGIYAIEGRWDKTSSDARPSIQPLLALVTDPYKAKRAHFDVATRADLSYRLKHSYKGGFGILYIAMHGKRAGLRLDDGDRVALPDMAAMMMDRFSGWAVHFGSCEIMAANESIIRKFKRDTGADLVSGYTKSVAWADSDPLEVCWLGRLRDGFRTLPPWTFILEEKTGFIKI